MRSLLLLFSGLALAPALSAQSFFEVPASYPTIQAAIDAATTGGIVRIAAGTFSGSGNTDLDPRGKSITIRGDSAQTTTIDCQGSVATPRRAFRIFSGGSSLIIERLKIEGGFESEGGALQIRNARPTIRQCVFRNCEASQAGGAIVLDGVAPAQILDCRFEHCRAPIGGGFWTRSVLAVRVSGSTFDQVYAQNQGGAAFVEGAGADFDTCMFSNASCGDSGGALFVIWGARLTVSDSSLVGNEAASNGGAISGLAPGTRIVVERTSFQSNRTQPVTGGSGGAVYGVDIELRLTDCQVEGGSASGLGGGIVAFNCDTRLERCRLRANVVRGHGGGIALEGPGSVATLIDCEIWENQVQGNVGAGLFARSGVALSVSGGSVLRNVSPPGAGGLFLQQSSASFNAVTIADNDSGGGGGGFIADGCSLQFSSCEIRDNRASGGGGGAGVLNGGTICSFSETSVIANQSLSWDAGAFEVFGGSQVRFERCHLRDNLAAFSHGAFRVGDAVIDLDGCLLAGNAAGGDAGAIGVLDPAGRVRLRSCTIADNASNAAVLRCDPGVITLENSIVWDNFRSPFAAVNGGVITATYCDVQGGFPGVGNRNVSPSFVNAAAGDYRLSSISPLRDAGSSALVPATLVVDLDGSPRTVGLAVDIGADEYLAPLPGTLDPLRFVTRVNGAGAELTTKSAPAGSTLALHFEALSTPLQSAVGLVLGNAVPVAAPIFPTPGLPGLQLDLAQALFFVGGTAPPPFGVEYLGSNGIARSYLVPPGLGGLRLRLQGVALGPMTQSGFLAFSDAQELMF